LIVREYILLQQFSDPVVVVLLNVRARMLEIRKEEPFDRPCSETEPMRGRRLQTYLVDLAEVYDGDLHLRLRLAYPKGC
jgi:hypothetical protein